MARPLFALLLLPLLAVAAPVPKSIKAKPNLDGRWVTTERTIGRRDMTDVPWVWEINGEELRNFVLADDNRLIPTQPDDTKITLSAPDPSRPNELDYTYASGRGKGVLRGRMAWDGDEFVICFEAEGKERPAEVKRDPTLDSYYRFKRMADK